MPPRRNTPALVTLPETHVAPIEERHSPVLEDIPEEPEEPRRSPPPEDQGSNPDFRRSRSVQDQPTASLTEAILLMTQELRRRENPTRNAKIKEPDTYDGSDPRKLNNLLLQCNLFFRSSSVYEDDTARVSFALSYLRGMALDYFEPSIIDSD